MEIQPEVLFSCQRIAIRMAKQQTVVAEAKEEIVKQRKELKKIFTKHYLPICSEVEERFLALNVCVKEGKPKKTVLDMLVEHCVGEEHEMPDEGNLIIAAMSVQITADELNQNGFFYDSERREIEEVVDSVFEKFSILVTFKEFDRGGKYMFFFSTEQTTIA